MPAADARRVADVYRDTKARITQLLTGPDAGVWASPVPACPGWSVRDVVSHLTAVAQDWADGRLAGAPSDEQTAEHVRRFDSLGENALLKAWSDHTNRLHHLADTTGREPPLGDIACHEHDIRGAIGEPGARDAESVRWTADRLLTILRPPVPLRVVIEGGEYRCGPTGGTCSRSMTPRRRILLRTYTFPRCITPRTSRTTPSFTESASKSARASRTASSWLR